MLATPFSVLGQKPPLFCFSFHLSHLTKWIRVWVSLSSYLYGMHQVVLTLCLPLLGEMPSQQGIFPKRSLGRNPKIDSFSSHHQTTPSESLDRRPTSLAMPIGPIGCHFFHVGLWGSFYLFSWAFSTCLFYFYLLLCPWACWLLFLPCWSTGLFTSVLGLPWPIYFIFTYCCAHGPAGCYSCYTSPLGFFPLSLGSHGLFTLLLPFVVLMGLLAVIPAILAHWVFYLFF